MTTTWTQPGLFDDLDTPTKAGPAAPFHPSDPWTSKAAAARFGVRAGTARFRVLEALGAAHAAHTAGRSAIVGRCAWELAGELGLLATTAGTRLGELVADGYAVAARDADGNAVRRRTDTRNGSAVVYRITTAGVAKLDELHQNGARAPQRHPYGTPPPGRPSGRRPSRYGLTDLPGRILEELHRTPAGLTDHELADLIGDLTTAVGTARKQLADRDLVEHTDTTRPTPSGNQATVHRLTRRGEITLANRIT